MNLILSIVKYIREKQNIKHGKVMWQKSSYWNRYDYYLTNNHFPIVCFKDKHQRVGNFWYAYPNINLQMTFFASRGTLDHLELRKATKWEWIKIFVKVKFR